jgi:NAD(P)-dependent dehydrogenase (short-subunit alcohol dehydrogenase family)
LTDHSLNKRTALVTGASSGFGHHFVEHLAGQGVRVAAAARRKDRLDTLAETAKARGEWVLPVEMDVSNSKSVAAGVAAAHDALGRIDILVNNAGVTLSKPALDQDEADWDHIIGTNLKGAWLVARETALLMKDDGGGSIINIASILGFMTSKMVSTYGISKAGVIHMTKSLALELARYKIRVNAIAPGYIETDLNRKFFKTKIGQDLIQKLPQRRLGDVADMDGVLSLLAGDDSLYMTGSIITVDGGHSLALI